MVINNKQMEEYGNKVRANPRNPVRSSPSHHLALRFVFGRALVQRNNQSSQPGQTKPRKGDRGLVCEEDRLENELSLEHHYRLMSVYENSEGKRFWIITEADRSVTTILLPEEY